MARNNLLFILCTVIWGTTWLIIKYQLAAVSPSIGVFYRFLFAALFMFPLTKICTKYTLKYPLKNHLLFFCQGLFNFCLNYILTYQAESKLNSAIVALTFTSIIYFNMIGLRIFFKKTITSNVFLGATFGALGIIIIFWKQIISFQGNIEEIKGLSYGIIATVFASIGNMFAFKNHQLKIPVLVFNSYGMFYGAICSFLISICMKESFQFPITYHFISSLAYLTLLGTITAFWAYQTLLGSIGADRAAYSSISALVVAVIVSGIFENLQITPLFIMGIIFCLIGNILSLKGIKKFVMQSAPPLSRL